MQSVCVGFTCAIFTRYFNGENSGQLVVWNRKGNSMSRALLSLRRADAFVPAWVPVLSRGARDAVACIEYPLDRARLLPRRLAVLGLALVLVIAVQAWMGAGLVERGIYSDDAAHFMNGLLVRDYLLQAPGTDPVAFAEQYYINYPKIAPLMWPPLFHVTFGLTLLAGGPPGGTALLLLALCCAWVVFRLHMIVERLAGSLAALIAVALLLTTPMVMTMTSVVMLDLVIATFTLESAYWLTRFMRSNSSRDAIVFGIFVSLACLTKGTGVIAVLIPAVMIPITGRWDLLRSRGLYLSAGVVLVLGVPLLAASAMFDAGIGDFGPVSPSLVTMRLEFYAMHLRNHVGIVPLGFAALGVLATIARARHRPNVYLPLAEGLVALLGATCVFHLLNPHLSDSSRYLTPAIPALIGLAMLGAAATVDWLQLDGRRRLPFVALIGVIAMSATVARVSATPGSPLGYREVFEQLTTSGQLAGRRLLVVSDEFGEGAAVTEAAVRGLQPAPTIIRGSKLLARGTWMVAGHAIYDSSEAILCDLEDLHVVYVLLDRSPGAMSVPYFQQVSDMVGHSGRVERVDLLPSGSGTQAIRPLELYRVRVKSAGNPKPLRLNLEHTLGRTLER